MQWEDDVELGILSLGTAWTIDDGSYTYFAVIQFTPNAEGVAVADDIELTCVSGAIDGTNSQWTQTVNRNLGREDMYWRVYSYDAPGGVEDILMG